MMGVLLSLKQTSHCNSSGGGRLAVHSIATLVLPWSAQTSLAVVTRGSRAVTAPVSTPALEDEPPVPVELEEQLPLVDTPANDTSITEVKLSPSSPLNLLRAKFIEAQRDDEFCIAMSAELTGSDSDVDLQLAIDVTLSAHDFNLEEDGMLVHSMSNWPRSAKVAVQWVVPKLLAPLILRLAHDDGTAAHGGIAATQARLSTRYFWREMAHDVRVYTSSCLVCLRRKQASTSRVATVPVPLWHCVSIDLLDCHLTSTAGMRYICAIVEEESDFTLLYAQKSKSAEDTAQSLFDLIMSHGASRVLKSDNGGEFLNDVVQSVCKLFSVRKVETSAYHPQANGRVESKNTRILKALSAFVDLDHSTWDQGLKIAEFALNTTPRSATGLTPFFHIYARDATLPHDAMMVGVSERALDLHQDVERRIETLRLARQAVDSAFEVRARAAQLANDKLRKTVKVCVGDLVLVKAAVDAEPNQVKKLSERWTGPWEIMFDTGSGVTFTCRLQGRRVMYRTIHVSLMKKYRGRPDTLRLTEPHALVPELADLPRGQWCNGIEERKLNGENNAWEYKLRMRDNALTPWLDAKRALE